MPIKYFTLMALFSFFASLIYGFYHMIKAFDFVKEAYIYTGIFALFFLNLSIFFSLFQFKKTKTYPKLLGIFAAFWTFLHFLNYFIFDRNAQILRLFDDISHRLLEASGFAAFIIIFFMFLSSFTWLKKIEKIRKLGYLCLVLASYHYFLSPKVPMFWEWSALIVALFYFILHYIKILKSSKANNPTFIKT
ncbi:sulfite oxidase heme-binding subunit YedZ [Campylobacter sp. VicNov18]|uniref:sulfite oxidase heme-binding subunit YedZ n=1 Tax=Campylobacter bilis TaxID=2691918 RepID=UPI00130EE7F2|nr:sulfite oxidase heme-binding subunit YedZ [Campylobacter bilis]MPV63323.1 sulfite oxidase heme-binding subunit YedZ [Campylobacter hepaticus]MBM0636822.1 sulfite oxidase heme-binding subunit YedZ [Campylobacter bilis]MCC8277394.1 sulfite oxidase heme-binding subunit YedZ [Campylobacter bilis]MCC8299137.1 sulfite oxidase heme-binding subunit YedZ [Campylobacter bilis]MCC8300303.1 sulfite oxidase heme-binding subunit YedZ [Campylobacter bilis]